MTDAVLNSAAIPPNGGAPGRSPAPHHSIRGNGHDEITALLRFPPGSSGGASGR